MQEFDLQGKSYVKGPLKKKVYAFELEEFNSFQLILPPTLFFWGVGGGEGVGVYFPSVLWRHCSEE